MIGIKRGGNGKVWIPECLTEFGSNIPSLTCNRTFIDNFQHQSAFYCKAGVQRNLLLFNVLLTSCSFGESALLRMPKGSDQSDYAVWADVGHMSFIHAAHEYH